MGSDIALTRSQRVALIDLGENQRLSSRTQMRLSSGKRINSVVDDSVNYFKSKTLEDRAKDFNNLKTEMGQAISHLEVTLEAVSGLEKILGQMKGILEASRSQSATERKLANTAIKELGKQMNQLVKDASYGGANLIASTAQGRTIQFGIRDDSQLKLPGLDLIKAATVEKRMFSANMYNAANGSFQYSALLSGAAGLSVIGANNSQVSVVIPAVNHIDKAISRLRGHAQSLGSNVAILKVREQFTQTYVSMNTVGSEKYTLAEQNEEGANLVALETRQQMAFQALSVAGRRQRSVLTLFN